jgi:CelD/BcsL family acetyltransferase involved in cellulose biosynthesis
VTQSIRSMPDGSAIAIDIRTLDDVVEALRAAKAFRNLSNEWCDEIGDMTKGQTDKCLGPSAVKGLSRFLFGMYLRQFAVKLVMLVDPDMERIMRPKWEGRDTSNVRVDTGRISKKILERAKPLVLKETGAAGAAARNTMLSPKHRTEIATKAGATRWKMRGVKKDKRSKRRRAWYRGRREKEQAAVKTVPESALK